MHPVLLTIDLGGWRLPLLPWLSLVTVGVAAVALIGYKTRRPDLAVPGTVGALVAGTAAVLLRDQVFVPHSFVVGSYGALLAASLVLGWWWTVRLAEREGIGREVATRAIIITAALGLIGARGGYVLLNGHSHFDVAHALDLRSGGLFGFAGLASGLAALVLSQRGSALSWKRLANAASPAVGLGLIATQLGGYLSGGGYGRLLGDTGPQWLRVLGTFPRWPSEVLGGAGSVAWIDHVERGVIDVQAASSAPVHPAQLYLAAAAAVLLAVVIWVSRKRWFSGAAFLSLVYGYGALRFSLDPIRADSQRCLLGPALASSLVLGVGLVALGVALLLGPLRLVPAARWRAVLWLLVLTLPSTLCLIVVGDSSPTRVSVSQCVAFASAVAAAWAWRRWDQGTSTDAEQISSTEDSKGRA
jgi:phosphatidylglycerol:prolipoprotein diacylglycerol transferase